MRTIAILVACACVAVSVAWAEKIEQVRWDRSPDGRAFARLYPNRAQNERISGAAVLCCTINDDRSLNCTSPFEWPAGYGFGAATLELSREFRVAPETLESSRAVPGAYIQRQINWVIAPGSLSSELDEVYRRITEGTRNICNRPATPVS